ncbi:hypothetical protein B0H21DRAFT_822760 [Amylocystis lapponica]|nr:hypothetical protein B0H21DRAFT_822760 [Amylocystis lapponica]
MVYTRKSNVDKHPGDIVKGVPRCSAGEMAEVRRLEAEGKEHAAQQQAEKLKQVAVLENRQAQEDKRAETFGTIPAHAQNGRAAITDLSLKTPTKAAPLATTPKTSTRARQPKSTWADIDTYCKDLENDTENQPVTPAAGKHKSMATDDLPATTKGSKKAKPAHASGLLASWTQTGTTKPSKFNPATTQRQPISASSGQTAQIKATCNTAPVLKAATAIDVHDYGGYISSDEDDTEECAHTALVKTKSAVNGGDATQNTAMGIIVIKRKEPASMIKAEIEVAHLETTPESHGGSGANGNFVKADLPVGAEPRWTKKFIPTVLDTMGTLSNPWEIMPAEQVQIYQDVWDMVMSNNPQTITSQCAIYSIALQRVYDWCSNFAKAALTHVRHFFKHNIQDALKKHHLEDTPEGRAAWVSEQITGNFLFQYGKIDTLAEDRSIISWSKPFQYLLVLSTLACHMNTTASALPYIKAVPKGALAMSVIAVERAIETYRTGVYESGDKFLEQIWSPILNLYQKSITGLKPETWEVIVISTTGLDTLICDYPIEIADDDAMMDGCALIVDHYASD